MRSGFTVPDPAAATSSSVVVRRRPSSVEVPGPRSQVSQQTAGGLFGGETTEGAHLRKAGHGQLATSSLQHSTVSRQSAITKGWRRR